MPNSDSPIAQSVERRTVNPQVVGSSPTRGAIQRRGQKTSPFSLSTIFCEFWAKIPQNIPSKISLFSKDLRTVAIYFRFTYCPHRILTLLSRCQQNKFILLTTVSGEKTLEKREMNVWTTSIFLQTGCNCQTSFEANISSKTRS